MAVNDIGADTGRAAKGANANLPTQIPTRRRRLLWRQRRMWARRHHRLPTCRMTLCWRGESHSAGNQHAGNSRRASTSGPWRTWTAGPNGGRGQGRNSVAWLSMWTNCWAELIVHCPFITSQAAPSHGKEGPSGGHELDIAHESPGLSRQRHCRHRGGGRLARFL